MFIYLFEYKNFIPMYESCRRLPKMKAVAKFFAKFTLYIAIVIDQDGNIF